MAANLTRGDRRSSRALAKQASRAALIAAAIELFAKEGLDVSLDNICARAGYTRGVFYVHFKDRDQLLAAVMERVGDSMLDAMRARGPQNDLHAMSRRFLQALSAGELPLGRRGGMRPHHLLDACARSPQIRDQYASLLRRSAQQLSGSVHESQRLRRVRGDVEPHHLSSLLLATMIGIHLLYDLEAPVDLMAAAQTLFRVLAP